MEAIEDDNPELRGILPKDYSRVTNPTLATLLRTFSDIPMDIEGDVFGRIYEYFLGKFAIPSGDLGDPRICKRLVHSLDVRLPWRPTYRLAGGH